MNNKINKKNYEAFLLDLMEGKLSKDERCDLLLFLEQHPEIEFDYEFEIPKLERDDLAVYHKKEGLKKLDEEIEERIVYYLDNDLSEVEKRKFEGQVASNPQLDTLVNQYKNTFIIPTENLVFEDTSKLYKFTALDEELISYTEGLTAKEDEKKLINRAELDPELLKQLNLFKQTYLVAEETIRFPNKAVLKRSATIVYLKKSVVYLSIAATIVLLFMVFYPTNNKQVTNGSLVILVKNKINHKALIVFSDKENDDKKYLQVGRQNKIKQTNNFIRKDSIEKKSLLPELIKNDEQINNLPFLATNNNINAEKIVFSSFQNEPVNINYYEENDLDLQVNEAYDKITASDKFSNILWDQIGKESNQTRIGEKRKPSLSMNLLAFIGKGLKKLGNKNSGAQKINNPDEDFTEYNVTIAGISITKKQLN